MGFFAASSTPSLNFQISSGGNENFFHRDNQTSAQILLTSPDSNAKISRFVAALPAGNSGALVYFLPLAGPPQDEQRLIVSLINDTLTSTTDSFDNVGIQADLSFSGNATLGVTIVGAVRAMRDYVEGGGSMNPVFNYTLGAFNESSVWLHRRYINSSASVSGQDPEFKYTSLHLSIPPGNDSAARFSVTPNTTVNGAPTIDLFTSASASASNSTIQVRIRVLSNETSLEGFDASSLFLNASQATTPGVLEALQRLESGTGSLGDAAQQVSFLTYKEKSTAGGWRFLTYFGRDTLIALRLLMPIMTSEAIESVLSAVIERANVTGALCHEETIGDYASFNHHPELGDAPFYDYKMIDTELRHQSETCIRPSPPPCPGSLFPGPTSSPRPSITIPLKERFTSKWNLCRNSGKNIHIQFRPCPSFPSKSNLHQPSFPTPRGISRNWRDSNEGIGFGKFPYDVNTALVPASLRATQRLVEEGVLQLQTATGTNANSSIDDVVRTWEENALGFFEVEVEEEEAERRLRNFVNDPRVALGEGILDNATSTDNATMTKFYALSLRDDGSPVEVLNSDLSFSLMYGSNVSRDLLEHVVSALQPYPRGWRHFFESARNVGTDEPSLGLLTNVGMVVANPAYDSDTSIIGILDRRAYHGTVVWHQGLMAGGLARQLNLCGMNNSVVIPVDIDPAPGVIPSWCEDGEFVQALSDAEKRLWASIEGASESEARSSLQTCGLLTQDPLQICSPKYGPIRSITQQTYSLLLTWQACPHLEPNPMLFNCGRTAFWGWSKDREKDEDQPERGMWGTETRVEGYKEEMRITRAVEETFTVLGFKERRVTAVKDVTLYWTTMSSSPNRLVSSSLLAISLAASTYASPLSTSPYNLPTQRSPFTKAPLFQTEHYHGTVNGSYIIKLREDISPSLMMNHFNFVDSKHQDNSFVAPDGCSGVKHVYDSHVLKGYAGCFHEDVIEQLRFMPEVEHIELDQIVRATDDVADDEHITKQKGAPWGLARISHRDKLKFGTFTEFLYDIHGGEGVDAYVIDTGIQVSHPEFEGRATWGKTVPMNDIDEDANGHGTHCAGTIASKSYGVAKKANVIAVKVLGSNGSGTMSDVIRGVDWAASSAKAKADAAAEEVRTTGKTSHKGSVANMSLGGGKSPTLDSAVNKATESGMAFAVAAGNENQDACKSSPAAAEKALTLGASSIGDERAYFSNWGTCVDIFGPGLNIKSTWPGNLTNTISGTSMASPHAAGLMAYLLSIHGHPTFNPQSAFWDVAGLDNQRSFSIYAFAHAALPSFISTYLPSPNLFEPVAPVPSKPPTPAKLKELIIEMSTKDALTDTGKGSPNLLLFSNATA
ncbi:hypothetical protein D9758_005948 [Tetrapyrgos nigripes]|uniref:Peptidase S8/S53 domain-containing protein n=1 Tax=Tetrapyrgos nigripes TaxID=182062 RepID=A0A8H5G2U6_9AGAR|nr:hypothetical protein D9758_005948 [Tetrapyrgos nigripes]